VTELCGFHLPLQPLCRHPFNDVPLQEEIDHKDRRDG
jgi:hypothetical protein